jgi:hypothetical protein
MMKDELRSPASAELRRGKFLLTKADLPAAAVSAKEGQFPIKAGRTESQRVAAIFYTASHSVAVNSAPIRIHLSAKAITAAAARLICQPNRENNLKIPKPVQGRGCVRITRKRGCGGFQNFSLPALFFWLVRWRGPVYLLAPE